MAVHLVRHVRGGMPDRQIDRQRSSSLIRSPYELHPHAPRLQSAVPAFECSAFERMQRLATQTYTFTNSSLTSYTKMTHVHLERK